MLQSIINYLEINPLLGTAGQPEPDQFRAIQEAGYQVVINLLPTTSPDAIRGEAELVASLGMQYIHIPVVWQSPEPSDLNQFFEAMAAIHARKAFVHCAMNMRVSAFVFLYRVLIEGVPADTARAAMLEIWQPNDTWQAFIDAMLASADRPGTTTR